MSSKFILVCTVPDTGATVAGEISASTSTPGNANTSGAGAWDTVQDIAAYLQTKAMGDGINIRYADTAVSASTTGTFTCAPTDVMISITVPATGAVTTSFPAAACLAWNAGA